MPQRAARSLSSVLLGILIAIFPKCPLCWAAYMSMLGGVGLANIPYMKWLYPLLIVFLGLHLLLLLRKAKKKGFGPFLLSLAGSLALLGGRGIVPAHEHVLMAGMLLILSGSLWNTFTVNRFRASDLNHLSKNKSYVITTTKNAPVAARTSESV